MAAWGVMYPINFTASGDKTNLGIQKHINEIARLYALIGELRGNFNGAGYPSQPERNQLYINPNTLEGRVFVGVNGDDDWRILKTQPMAHDMDLHNPCTMSVLQDLVSDASLVFLDTTPAPADSGKALTIDSTGKIVLTAGGTVARHDYTKHIAGTIANLQSLVNNAVLVYLSAAPTSADSGKQVTIDSNGAVVLTAAPDIPKMESVAALPDTPDPDTWYFVQGS